MDAFAAAMRAIVSQSLVTLPHEVQTPEDWALLACTAVRVDNVAALAQAIHYSGGVASPALARHWFFLVRLAHVASPGRATRVSTWLHQHAPDAMAQYCPRH
jgi:hypothetical protein